VDGFGFCIAVPAIVSIWEAAVIDGADDRVDYTNLRIRATRQSVGSDNSAEGLLARKVVVKGKELLLLSLR